MIILTPEQAAKLLQISTSTLTKLRSKGGGPKYLKYGRAVRYDSAELLDWARSRQRENTSQSCTLAPFKEGLPSRAKSDVPGIRSTIGVASHG